MPVPDDEMIVETREFFVSEHIFNRRATAAEVEAFLKSDKRTVNLSMTYNQGGKRATVAVEKTRLSEEEANDVRRVIGMDYEVEEDEPPVSKPITRKIVDTTAQPVVK